MKAQDKPDGRRKTEYIEQNGVKYAVTQIPPSYPDVYEFNRRENRRKGGLETWLTVSMAAKEMCVTPRRIRALLAEGRLLGQQLENGYWEVKFPFVVVMARRGPQLLVRRPKKAELRPV